MFDDSLKELRENRKSANKDYSYSRELLKENKINSQFLEKLKFLTLEDLVYLKLEVASIGLKGKLYNFPILKYSSDIVKEAIVRYSLSATKSKREAAMILGVPKTELNRLIKNNNIKLNRD